jgi:hypothetical protein
MDTGTGGTGTAARLCGGVVAGGAGVQSGEPGWPVGPYSCGYCISIVDVVVSTVGEMLADV